MSIIDQIALWIGRALMIGGAVGLAVAILTFALWWPIESSFRRLKRTYGARKAVNELGRILREQLKK